MSQFEVTIISVLLMIFVGVLLKKINVFKTEDVHTINKIVFNVAFPCLVFKSLYSADLSILPTLGTLPLIGLLCAFVVGVISYIVLSLMKLSKKTKWSVLITVVLGNTGFIGYPIVLGVFGDPGFLRAIFFDINTTISFIILSIILMFLFGGNLKEIGKHVLTFPLLWAVILGISVNLLGINIGKIPFTVISYFGNVAIPLIMISTGLTLSLSGFKYNLDMVSFTSIVKLLVFPGIMLVLLNLFHFTGYEYSVAFIESAMPSGMLASILAIRYDLDFHLTSDCIVLSTLFSLVTLPILISFII